MAENYPSVAASLEKTFALIKPDAVKNGYADEITNLAELFGFKIVAKKKFMASTLRGLPSYTPPNNRTMQGIFSC